MVLLHVAHIGDQPVGGEKTVLTLVELDTVAREDHDVVDRHVGNVGIAEQTLEQADEHLVLLKGVGEGEGAVVADAVPRVVLRHVHKPVSRNGADDEKAARIQIQQLAFDIITRGAVTSSAKQRDVGQKIAAAEARFQQKIEKMLVFSASFQNAVRGKGAVQLIRKECDECKNDDDGQNDKNDLHRQTLFVVLGDLGQVIDHVADGDKLVDIVVFDLDAERTLAELDQLIQLQRIDAEIVDQLGVERDVRFVGAEVFNQHGFDFFKHSFLT